MFLGLLYSYKLIRKDAQQTLNLKCVTTLQPEVAAKHHTNHSLTFDINP